MSVHVAREGEKQEFCEEASCKTHRDGYERIILKRMLTAKILETLIR
jgi:hypothetical protein